MEPDRRSCATFTKIYVDDDKMSNVTYSKSHFDNKHGFHYFYFGENDRPTKSPVVTSSQPIIIPVSAWS